MNHESSNQLIAKTPANRSRRSGVVLIMVVAVLAILFVSGAALLTTVTFETKTLDVVREVRENEVMVTTIEQEVWEILRDGFLNDDGIPYSAESGDVIDSNDPKRRYVNPTNGEIPGLHLIDLTEPEDDGTDARISFYSNFDRARKRQVSIAMPTLDPMDDPLDNEYERLFPIVFDQSLVDLNQTQYETAVSRDPTIEPEARPAYIQDADGDGIPDSYAVRLDSGMLPPNIRASIADRLRDPTTLPNASDPDALWLTLKVVAHGSMVNLNTHIPYCDEPSIPGNEFYYDVLVANALGITADFDLQVKHTNGEISRSYLPESHEWALRNRGLLLPFSAPQSRLFAEFGAELVQPNQRWWQYDRATIDDYSNSAWRQKLDPTSDPTNGYDRVHLLTTISHDDNLIRSGMNTNGVDWIEEIKLVNDSDDGNVDRNFNPAGPFQWAGYPHFLRGNYDDKRLGRLKFSFPFFSKEQAAGGWLPNGRTLDTLDQTDTAVNEQEKMDLVRLIQDAFMLQLRNHAEQVSGFYFNTNGVDTSDPIQVAADNKRLSIIAAALTANMFDFVDGDDVPTEVVVRDWKTGLDVPNLKVYGLERQPYITELLMEVPPIVGGPPVNSIVEGQSVFAIELYNPYDVAINLSDFEITDLTDEGDHPINVYNLPTGDEKLIRISGVDLAVAGTINPGQFMVLHGYGGAHNSPGEVQLGEYLVFDRFSKIALQRKMSSGAKVTVDQVDLTNLKFIRDHSDSTFELQLEDVPDFGSPDPPESYMLSMQRDTTANAWRFTVPKYRYFADELTGASPHSLGIPNVWTDSSIRPVHIDFANTGVMRTAFPTTGTMLLLMRHAHLSDPDVGADVVPFNHVHGTILAEQSGLIDNGRMPVFDDPGTYRVRPSVDDNDIQGITALPWGQLVFDYFTALPLRTESTPCDDSNLQATQGYPKVDMDGLRVSGRININTAPWSIISGLPLMDMDKFNLDIDKSVYLYPDPSVVEGLKDKISSALYPTGVPKAKRYWNVSDIDQPDSDQPSEIGREFAVAIDSYRKAVTMPIPPGGDTVIDGLVDFDALRGPLTGGSRKMRAGYGFLTVGELLNVRHSKTSDPDDNPATDDGALDAWTYNVDVGAVHGGGDYVSAVARMVALGDWVTTKSHVFTVYGTIRGQFDEDYSDVAKTRGSLQSVDQKAIRFQSTIDRLPLLFNPRGKPTRIGARTIGQYSDVRSD
ncbi:MAG: hypothetical protein DHS20C16_03050 [Phycisphaerae bacterium]|nr:MAG: hypothetical protein DHS20C16_03050 [Phycisphaerae bacterium]